MAFDILNQLSVGIVVVDRCANVLFANTAAKSLSAGNGPLRINARLTCPTSTRRLDDVIRLAVDTGCGRAVTLDSPDSDRPLMLVVKPMQGTGDGDARGARATMALVMLCDIDHPAQVPAAWMMEAYGLTAAEVRVAVATSLGATILDTARRLKISPNTVKTHLRRVYDKTGTRRQAELTRLMATIGLARDVAAPSGQAARLPMRRVPMGTEAVAQLM